jgi:hypothetical protein
MEAIIAAQVGDKDCQGVTASTRDWLEIALRADPPPYFPKHSEHSFVYKKGKKNLEWNLTRSRWTIHDQEMHLINII